MLWLLIILLQSEASDLEEIFDLFVNIWKFFKEVFVEIFGFLVVFMVTWVATILWVDIMLLILIQYIQYFLVMQLNFDAH